MNIIVLLLLNAVLCGLNFWFYVTLHQPLNLFGAIATFASIVGISFLLATKG